VEIAKELTKNFEKVTEVCGTYCPLNAFDAMLVARNVFGKLPHQTSAFDTPSFKRRSSNRPHNFAGERRAEWRRDAERSGL
jgi:hypothetical protein